MLWQHGKDELKIFLEKLNSFHPSIKFTCEAFREKVIILMYTLLLIADFMLSKLTVIDPLSCHPYIPLY